MKFLCLHGNGTNTNVMKLQTAPLLHELEDDHEYEFVEAALEAPMSEGVEALSSPDHQFYAYYDPRDNTTVPSAISHLDEYVENEGPFDAILGFSAGAVLAAMYLAERQRKKGPLPFKCAVFLSSAVNVDIAAFLGVDANRHMIRIPTVHIWGSADKTAPTGGADLSRMCDPKTRLTLIHDGGHEIPRKEYLTQAVQSIRRTIYQASH